MVKYLSKISEKLNFFKNGLEKNSKKWSVFSENPSIIQEQIDEVETMNLEITKLKNALSQKYSQARELRKKKKEFIGKLEKRAAGIHADEPEKLVEYGINKGNSGSNRRQLSNSLNSSRTLGTSPR